MGQFHFRLDPATSKALALIATNTERSKSAVVRHLLKREAERLKEQERQSRVPGRARHSKEASTLDEPEH
jgi:hypothetical protein